MLRATGGLRRGSCVPGVGPMVIPLASTVSDPYFRRNVRGHHFGGARRGRGQSGRGPGPRRASERRLQVVRPARHRGSGSKGPGPGRGDIGGTPVSQPHGDREPGPGGSPEGRHRLRPADRARDPRRQQGHPGPRTCGRRGRARARRRGEAGSQRPRGRGARGASRHPMPRCRRSRGGGGLDTRGPRLRGEHSRRSGEPAS